MDEFTENEDSRLVIKNKLRLKRIRKSSKIIKSC
jgi:hypothetical protein